MCGLFGYTFKKPAGIRLALMLAHAADNRGGQAWGYTNPQTGDVIKGLRRIARHSKRIGLMCQVMAHTRLATQGANVVENAHPFRAKGKAGDLLLAHNGQIFNGSPNFAVDSMELAHRLAHGLKISDLEGYGVITWTLKSERGRIYLAKLSDSGSISVAKTSKGVVYASEKDAVEAACDAAELKIKQFYRIETGTVYFLDNTGAFTTAHPELKLAARQFTGYEWRKGFDLDSYDLELGKDGVYRPKSSALLPKELSDNKPDEWAMGPGMMSRAELIRDLETCGYTSDEMAGLSFSDLCETWEYEYQELGSDPRPTPAMTVRLD